MIYHAVQDEQDFKLDAYIEEPASMFFGEDINFIAEAEQCGTTTYHWNFGDGTAPVVSNAVSVDRQAHTFQAAGTYDVTVVAAAPQGKRIKI